MIIENKELVNGTKSLKKQLAKIILWFLGRGFEVSACCDSKVIEEVVSWRENYSILIKIEGHGPCLFMQKKNNDLKYCGNQEADADLSIFFKNIDAALLVLTGRIGIDTAFAQHRFVVKGDIMESMSLVRCLCIVENYLFPRFITKKILRNTYRKETSSILLYTKSIFRTTGTRTVSTKTITMDTATITTTTVNKTMPTPTTTTKKNQEEC